MTLLSVDFVPVRFAVYGDLGNENPQSLARLQEETQKGQLDAILHVGDFAYDMATVSCSNSHGQVNNIV